MADDHDRIDAYLQRDQSMLGRAINWLSDSLNAFRGSIPTGQLVAGVLEAEEHYARIEEADHETPTDESVVSYSSHYIPSETYLDESKTEFRDHGEFEDVNEPDWEARCYEDYQRSMRNRDEFKGWSSEEISEWQDRLYQEALEEEADREEELEREANDEARDDLGDDVDDGERPVSQSEPDPWQDYNEAHADVAGDATLAHRLEDESPIDILADVQRQAREDAGLSGNAKTGTIINLQQVRQNRADPGKPPREREDELER